MTEQITTTTEPPPPATPPNSTTPNPTPPPTKKHKHKNRFDGLDTAAMTAHIHKTLLGNKLVNVYDGSTLSTHSSDMNGGVFLLKLANPTPHNNEGTNDKTESHHRTTMLLLESGVRFHTFPPPSSSSSSSNPTQPSSFAMKLRKHLRNLRLENVRQLGNLDRVVDFRFGSGERAHHLILELYGLGNLILCDGRFEILGLLRVHEYGGEGKAGGGGGKKKGKKKRDGGGGGEGEEGGGEVKVRVGNIYPVTYATTLSATTTVHTNPANQDNDTKPLPQSLLEMNEEEAHQWTVQELTLTKTKHQTTTTTNPPKTNSKPKPPPPTTLQTLLSKPSSGVFHYGPSLLTHCILTSNLTPNLTLTLSTLHQTLPPSTWTTLLQTLRYQNGPDGILQTFYSKGSTKGYILYSPTSTPSTPQHPHANKTFEEFQPHLLHQHTHRPYLTFPTFPLAISTYYTHLSTQRTLSRLAQTESTALSRLSKIRTDQQTRLTQLESDVQRMKLHAELVELHAGDVDKVLGVLRGAVESGMSWEGIGEMVEVERAGGNPIAALVGRVDLEGGRVGLVLPDTREWEEGDEGEGEEGGLPELVEIEVVLEESAYGNARRMYERYRGLREKVGKTIQAERKALDAAEANAERQIEAVRAMKASSLSSTTHTKTPHWFEKFHWFITSDNYLVLGGRDAQQNEVLVKRYLRPGDAYLHADVHGAPSCILRAKRRRLPNTGKTSVLPLSPQALHEAGTFAICRSSAWASRMVTSAWWVESWQVSKTAPSGEYLTGVGSFMVRGKKNFLPASGLEMGLGVLFRLGDGEGVGRHLGERRDFGLMVGEEEGGEGDGDGDGDEDGVWEERKDGGDDGGDDGDGGDDALVKEDSHEAEPTITNGEPKEESQNTLTESKTNTKHTIQTEDRTKENDQEEEKKENQEPPSLTDDTTTDTTTTKKKRKGLSARDRKLIKKYGSLENAQVILKARQEEEEEARAAKQKATAASADEGGVSQSEPTTVQSNPNNNHGKNQNTTVTRGKKSKLKKIAKKYADQDDEDRELAFLALQGGETATTPHKKGKKGKKKIQRGGTSGGKPIIESSNQISAAAETTALLIQNTAEVVDDILPEEVRTILAECVTVPSPPPSQPQRSNSATSESTSNGTVRWDKLDVEVLEDLITLQPLEAQIAVANRLAQLVRTTRVDNYSASLAGIVRTVQRFGYEGIQPTEDDDQGGGGGGEGKQRKTKAEKAAEQEAWREILAEDGIIEDAEGDNDGEVDDTAEINKLTGQPHPQDLLLYALPVCAPYHTLRNYTYRVKLTPGSQKRGKASKQCLEMFQRTLTGGGAGEEKAVMNRYRDLIKGVNVNDWAQTICGDVKIASAGASKVVKKQKAGAKKKKNKKR